MITWFFTEFYQVGMYWGISDRLTLALNLIIGCGLALPLPFFLKAWPFEEKCVSWTLGGRKAKAPSSVEPSLLLFPSPAGRVPSRKAGTVTEVYSVIWKRKYWSISKLKLAAKVGHAFRWISGLFKQSFICDSKYIHNILLLFTPHPHPLSMEIQSSPSGGICWKIDQACFKSAA